MCFWAPLEDKENQAARAAKIKKKRILKSEDFLRDFWDNTKENNICITGGPRKRRQKDQKTNLKR